MDRARHGHIDELTRRQLLQRAGVVVASASVVPAFLAACGGSTDGAAVGGGTSPTSGGNGQIGGPIDFLSWEGYDLPGETKEWRKQNGVKMRSTYIGSHDDIQARLKSGSGVEYDLITYYQGFYDLYRKLDILTPVDTAHVPNMQNMYPFFRSGDTSDRFWRVDGQQWGVPFTWGTIACNYRADKVDAPKSWYDLLEPEFKGKVGWPDDPNGAYLLAGHILGKNVPFYTRDDFDEINVFLRKMRDQTPGIAPSFGDLTNQLVAGDVLVAYMGWSAVDVWAQEKGADVQSVLPEEGSFSFCDSYAIPPTSDNVETTLAFINEALSPEVQAAQAQSLSAGAVVPEAVDLMPKEIQGLYPYDDIASHFERAPLYPNAPVEAEDGIVTYDELLSEFEKIKAGQ
jgi:spermidine/putrescine-binding protein